MGIAPFGCETDCSSSCDGGVIGPTGKSAYDIAVERGFVGTKDEWLASLQGRDGIIGTDGADGTDGLSAYEVALAQGFVGTEAEWLASLKGKDGVDGVDGRDAEYPLFAGHGGDVLAVKITEDGVEWVDPPAGDSAATNTEIVEMYSHHFSPSHGSGNVFSSGFFGGRAMYFPKAVNLKSVRFLCKGTVSAAQITPCVYQLNSEGMAPVLVAQGPTVNGVTPGIITLPLDADYAVTAKSMLIVGFIVLGGNLPIAKARDNASAHYTTASSVPAVSPAFTFAGNDWASMWAVVEDTTPGGANITNRFRLPFFFTWTPTSSEILGIIVADTNFVVPSNFAGDQFVSVAVKPTSAFTVTAEKNGAPIGTITIAPSGAVTLATTGGLAQVVNKGDVITFVAPVGVDATIANVAAMLWGNIVP